ncbi:MAG: hypothetical protein QXT34_03670 [Candidatus Aenigmatarchaeota archaeon]
MVSVLLPFDLKSEIEKFLSEITNIKKFRLHEKEIFIFSLDTYHLDFTHFAGKASELVYSITFGYSKKSFDVFKVAEGIYVSEAYQPFYTTIRKQKEEIENNIKAQLAHIATAITDAQLIAHDYRKYKHFVKIIDELEEIERKIKESKEKKEDLLKRKKELDQMLRNIFIDQVDIHTGDFSIINMARTRWTTFISDFLSLDDEKTPEDVLNKLKNITKAEAIQLSKKNQLYIIWREEFKKIVKERERELKKLLLMRKASIDNYKEMLRPLIARYLAIREEPIFFVSPSLSFIKSYTRPFLIDSVKWWIIKPLNPYLHELEKTRPGRIDLKRVGFITESIIEKLEKMLGEKRESLEKKIGEIVMPVEPSIDRVVLAGIEVINKNFGTNFTIKDALSIRETLFKKEKEPDPRKERWKLSPFYALVEISLDRSIIKTYSGIEVEDFDFEIKPFAISQNLAILMYLQIKALEKYYENQINSFFGESLIKEVEIESEVSGKKIKQKMNVWLDIRSIDFILDEEEDFIKKIEEEKNEYYRILSDYSFQFEKTFLKKPFFAPYLLYESSIYDEYFSDGLIDIRNDINQTIASPFGFPI